MDQESEKSYFITQSEGDRDDICIWRNRVQGVMDRSNLDH
jgi:hypothetical protein